MDLMRFVAGEARWCFARVLKDSKPVTQADVREGEEGVGPIAGDLIYATYGFDRGEHGSFGTHKAKHGANARFGLHIYGTKGVIQLTTGALPEAYFLEDPSWVPGRSKAPWKAITSTGVGTLETLTDGGLG